MSVEMALWMVFGAACGAVAGTIVGYVLGRRAKVLGVNDDAIATALQDN